MGDLLYFIWGILPLLLLWLIVNAAGKSVVKIGGKESPKFYSKQLLFTLAALALSIALDKYCYPSIGNWLSSFGIEPTVFRWLTYPAILTLGAIIQQLLSDKKTASDDAEKTRRRMKYAPK